MIEFCGITKRYGKQVVLENFCAAMEPKGVTCFMGVSGCGKTTLLRIAARLEQPDSGEVRGIPERLAIVFQEDRLLPWLTATENVAFVLARDEHDAGTNRARRNSRPMRKAEAAMRLAAVGLTEDADKRVSKLSGGMKRRVAIARALAAESEMLLMDEPFKGLDEGTKQRMVELVLEAARTKPVMVITHDLSEAKLLGGRIYTLGESRPS